MSAAGRIIKRKVQPNKGEHVPRFFHNTWAYRVGQLTTGNMKSMREASLDTAGTTPVHSDLQPHLMHTFRGDKHPSLCIAVPKASVHDKNLPDCPKVSFMCGHTDPQIFHWFKQLGTIPPRSIISGRADVLTGDLIEDVWERGFVRHPTIHEMARKLWETDETKTEEEKQTIRRREKEADQERMVRLSGGDWRKKHSARERNPTQDEDDESPIYVMKPEAFTVLRVTPEVMLYGDYGSNMLRVWEKQFQPMDPLARIQARFCRVVNTSRSKLVASLNINYNLKLTNVFIYSIDRYALWGMGTQELFDETGGSRGEQWSEYRFEYGNDMEVVTEAELEFWIKGLMRLGTPDAGGRNNAR
eukprot:CAMPEP_0174845150 /NCGR_PEP_ID=MMETSP1114-20130205/11552_1 /TAXON_ID=312471 /ORGANISM="Neobodo designis, Strain CCAP 1951/1" /LENGTH=357 /DNA_ID=CAMNT_0016079397 /DNA_START=30 /DNA_END=1100 /DNA_ORIENTATION=-